MKRNCAWCALKECLQSMELNTMGFFFCLMINKNKTWQRIFGLMTKQVCYCFFFCIFAWATVCKLWMSNFRSRYLINYTLQRLLEDVLFLGIFTWFLLSIFGRILYNILIHYSCFFKLSRLAQISTCHDQQRRSII